MSNYSIVPNAALTATANAIRTKSGSQATIEFDHNTGFKDAVNAIPSGGSGDIFNLSWPVGDLTTTGTSIQASLLYGRTGVTSVNGPNVLTVGNEAFRGMTGMVSVSLPSATSIGNSAFYGDSELLSVDFPLVTTVGSNAFNRCLKLSNVNLPSATTFGNIYTFESTAVQVLHFDKATQHPGCRNSNVEILVLPKLVKFASDAIYSTKMQVLDYGSPDITSGFQITSYDFDGPKTMQTIILRYGAVLPIQANTFYNLAFHDANYPGTLYVPQSLVTDYQNATNWSVVLSSYGNQVLPIEGSQYENYYADGTPIPTT